MKPSIILLLLCMLTNHETNTCQNSESESDAFSSDEENHELLPYGLMVCPRPDLRNMNKARQRRTFIEYIKGIKKEYTPQTLTEFIYHCINQSLAPSNDEAAKQVSSYGLAGFTGIVATSIEEPVSSSEIRHRQRLYITANMECLLVDGVIKKETLSPEEEALKELYFFITDRAGYEAYRYKKTKKHGVLFYKKKPNCRQTTYPNRGIFYLCGSYFSITQLRCTLR